MRDEVPDDGMQKYVAWCEITGAGKRERQERRRELQREHVVWQRDCMLPSQKEQLMSELKLPADDADRPDGERGHARILWEKGLISPGGLDVDGMAVCIAAASYEDFEALLHCKPKMAAQFGLTPKQFKQLKKTARLQGKLEAELRGF